MCKLCGGDKQCVFKNGAKTPCPMCNTGEWEIYKIQNELNDDESEPDENLCVDCNCVVSTGKERCLPCYKIYGQNMVLCMGCFKTKHKAVFAMCYTCNLKKRLRKK